MKRSKESLACIVLALILAGAAGDWVRAGEPVPPVTKNGTSFEFSANEAIAVETLVQLMSRFVGKSFLYNKRDLQQKEVNLSAPITVERDRAIEVFNRILQMSELAVVDYGTYAQVVPSTKAKSENIPLLDPQKVLTMAEGAQQVAVVVPINYADPVQTANILKTMTNSADTTVNAVPETGVIMVTGPASNLAHVVEIMKNLDVGSQTPRALLYVLKNANATDLAEQLGPLLQTPRGTASARRAGIQVKAYEPLNALIILATPPEHEEVAALIEQLDQEGTAPESALHVYAMRNREAVDVAKVLEAFFSGGTSTTPGAPGAAGTTSLAPLLPGLAPTGGPVKFRIVADEKSNSLVVVAPASEYTQLEKILTDLDRRRPQVLVEAAIVETSGEDLFSLGVDMYWLEDVSKSRSLYRSAFLLPNPTAPPAAPEGVPTTPFTGISPGVTLGYLKTPDRFTALLKAFSSNSKIRILAQPLLLTADAEEAQFKTTDERPVAQRSVTSTTQEAITTFGQYVEAGVTLKIKPYIRQAGHVHMQVLAELSDFSGSATENLPPPRVLRQLTAVVDVPSGRVVVIGGINRQRSEKNLERVPLVSRIPILGELFKNRNSDKTSSTVYLFLAPHILNNEEFSDLAEETQHRIDKLNQANEGPIPGLRDYEMGPINLKEFQTQENRPATPPAPNN